MRISGRESHVEDWQLVSGWFNGSQGSVRTSTDQGDRRADFGRLAGHGSTDRRRSMTMFVRGRDWVSTGRGESTVDIGRDDGRYIA